MKNILSSMLIFFAVAAVAIAQDTKPRTASGDKALLFSINGLGTFGVGGSYAGNIPTTGIGALDSLVESFGLRTMTPLFGFGMRYYLNDNLAFRGALGFGSSTKSAPRPNDTTGKTDDETSMLLGIAPAIEIHLVNAGPVTAYTGAFFNYSARWKFSGDEADTVRGTTTQSYNMIGGGALFGVEFFPWNAVSFGAEYQLGVYSTTSSTDVKGKSTDGTSYLDIGIGSLAVMLGVYF